MKIVHEHTRCRVSSLFILWLLTAGLSVGWTTSCHRLPSPLDEDPRLPQAFRTPQASFKTWVSATVSANAEAIRECYWPDMGKEELDSWLTENLNPNAPAMFRDAQLIEIRPATLVEVNFTFVLNDGEQMRGVMVRTREGWKIQSW